MYEDKYGFLWLQTYDNQVYRFDTRSETFESVPATEEKGGKAVIASVKVLPCGSVWLLSENEGAIRVKTDPATYRLTSEWYSDKSGLFPATHVYDIYEDLAGNEWMLTNNGLGMLAEGSRELVSYLWKQPIRKKRPAKSFIQPGSAEMKSFSVRITDVYGVIKRKAGNSFYCSYPVLPVSWR